MFFKFNIFGIILLLVSLFSVYTIYYSYKRRDEKLYYYFAFFAFFCCLNFIFQGLDILTTPFIVKSFFGQICAVGYVFIVPAWFFLVYYFIYQKDASLKIKFIVSIIPIICFIAAITNPWTHWFIFTVSWPPVNYPYQLQLYYTFNWGFRLICIYNIVMLFIMIFMLSYKVFKSNKIYWDSYVLLIIANVVCLIITLLAYTPIYTGFS